jgi:hypothetical protein
MASVLKVDKLDPQSGTALEIGTSGDTVTVPTGAGLTVTDEVKTNKISPATGTAFALGDSGDTFTVPSGATIVNSGTATGFGGANTPAFIAKYSGDGSSFAQATLTKLSFDSEVYDSGTTYDTSLYRFTPAVVGKYFLYARLLFQAGSTAPRQARIAIYKNGSLIQYVRWTTATTMSDWSVQISHMDDSTSTSDYYEAYAYQNNATSATGFTIGDSGNANIFYGYRIIT